MFNVLKLKYALRLFLGILILIIMRFSSNYMRHKTYKSRFAKGSIGTSTASHPDVTTSSKGNKSSPGGVILLAKTRSGSSFVGEIFNRKPGISYFYEPLFPFGICPRNESNSAEQYFPSVLRLNFTQAWQSYLRGEKLSKRHDDGGCISRKICFPDCLKCSQFLSRDSDICRTPVGNHACPKEIDLEKLSEIVAKSELMAFKVVYLCDISWIQPLLDNPELDLKIVHLVRDPRAMFNSKLQYHQKYSDAATNLSNLSYTYSVSINRLCQHMTHLVKYSDLHLIHSSMYMRVRFEEFAVDPIRWTEKIYKFVDIKMDESIVQWLKKATSETNSNSESFSTTRNSKDVVTRWMKQLPWKYVTQLQRECDYVMKSLGYIMFDDERSMRNYALSGYHF
ncbi:unnamed protein product [Clavelina lepadiformis]|uniref:Sulfotransferase n=1 Tax=Clavelina lepadiformis TaxID=159417 RepID=A0ABP0EZN6_CLALP